MATRGIFDTEGFVTSEAVEIDLPAASLPVRMASGAIDLAIVFLMLLLLVWAGVDLAWGDAALLQAVVIAAVVAAFVAVPTAQETLTRGRTVGKMALGLRTVRDDTGPIGFRHAFVRALLGVIELWLTAGSVAVLVAATNTRAKRLGDFAAGTYVVRERSRLSLPPPPEMPYPLAGWASTVDLGVIPDALAVSVRQFLARRDSLTPPARAQTGSELCHALVTFVSPHPPPDAPAEAVLSAIMAERRHRDLAKLHRDDALRARVLGPDPLER